MMHWELEDHLTHETIPLVGADEWRIGREEDPSATRKYFAFYESTGPNAPLQDKILVPITNDYDKCKKLLSSFVLSKVSRDHGILGIDRNGPYFIDLSTNGTTLRDERGYKVCDKGMKSYLHDGMVIYLAANYPLQLKRRTMMKTLIFRFKKLLASIL